MNTPTATPRTDAAVFLTHGAGYNSVDPNFARTLERELTETERLRFGADAERRQLRCDLFDAKWECEKLKFALVEWEAKERGWSKAVEKDAAELTRLRAEVERLTAKIGNQADRIRYLEGATNHATGTPLSQAIARAEKAEAELADWSVLNLWGGTPEFVHEFVKGQQNRIHHCQDLEAELITERARLDYLGLHMGMPQVSEALNLPFSQCFPIRDAIDRAMKNETPIP